MIISMRAEILATTISTIVTIITLASTIYLTNKNTQKLLGRVIEVQERR